MNVLAFHVKGKIEQKKSVRPTKTDGSPVDEAMTFNTIYNN